MTSETPLAALPVRQRGTIEIIDTALKLFRRYFGVLMAWSAIVAVAGLLGSFSLGFASILVWPLIYGAGACCIAAAVRGQSITFGQVWDFTKPRYGALLLLLLLTGLLLFAGMMVAMMVSGIVVFATIYALQAMSAPSIVSVILGGVGLILAIVVGSVVSVLAYAWLSMVPIIACLEDDKRGAAAMGRARELIKGSWLRVLGLSTLLTIAVAAVMGMVFGSLALFGQGIDAIINNADESALMQWALTFSAVSSFFFLFWNPIQTLIISVLYLDLRVRKEALDLEWTSYASAPPPVAASDAAPALPTDSPAVNAGTQPLSTSVFADAVADENLAPRPPSPASTVNEAPPPRPPSPTADTPSSNQVEPPRPPAPAPVAETGSPSSFGAGNLTAPPFDAGEGERDARA